MNDAMRTVRNIVVIVILALILGWNWHRVRQSDGNLCINNLMLIRTTKQILVKERHNATNYVVTMADIEKSMGNLPICPSGGTYTLSPVGKEPTCSIKGHVLPK